MQPRLVIGARTSSIEIARRSIRISVGMSLLLILLGVLALTLPGALGVAVAILVLWTIVFSGLAHIVYAWNARGTGDLLWGLSVGLVYLIAGFFLMLDPRESLASLTLVLVVLFLLEAGAMLGAFYRLRHLPGAGWLLLNAALAGILGSLIAVNWPSSSLWAIGTLLGVNLLFSGGTRLMLFWHGRHVRKFAG